MFGWCFFGFLSHRFFLFHRSCFLLLFRALCGSIFQLLATRGKALFECRSFLWVLEFSCQLLQIHFLLGEVVGRVAPGAVRGRHGRQFHVSSQAVVGTQFEYLISSHDHTELDLVVTAKNLEFSDATLLPLLRFLVKAVQAATLNKKRCFILFPCGFLHQLRQGDDRLKVHIGFVLLYMVVVSPVQTTTWAFTGLRRLLAQTQWGCC